MFCIKAGTAGPRKFAAERNAPEELMPNNEKADETAATSEQPEVEPKPPGTDGASPFEKALVAVKAAITKLATRLKRG